ncbi:hypothetical protein K8R33_02830 [archaeon]|nr:hypothetical protein [archaeon]
MKKEVYDKKLSEYIYSRTKPIFEKVLQEKLPSSMTTTEKKFRIVWRPNNYRRQMEVREGTKTLKTTITTHYSCHLPMTKEEKPKVNYTPHTNILSIKNYNPQITIQYGKNTLTGIWSQRVIDGKKQVFLLEGNNIEEVTSLLIKHKEKIERKIDAALIEFAKKFKIKYPYSSPKHTRSEDMIKGEEYLDNLPSDMVIHDTYFRKVYKNQVEFKSGKGEEHSAIRVKNYIKNRCLEDITPKITDQLILLNQKYDMNIDVTNRLVEQLDLHLSVLKGIDTSFKTFNSLLNKKIVVEKLIGQTQKGLNKWI